MDWFFWYNMVLVFSLLIGCIAWSIFFFYSVWRIERGITSEGKPRPCLWDGIGGRAMFYAWTLTFPNSNYSEREESLLCTADVLRYAKLQDYILGRILFFSIATVITTGLIGMAFNVNSYYT